MYKPGDIFRWDGDFDTIYVILAKTGPNEGRFVFLKGTYFSNEVVRLNDFSELEGNCLHLNRMTYIGTNFLISENLQCEIGAKRDRVAIIREPRKYNGLVIRE